MRTRVVRLLLRAVTSECLRRRREKKRGERVERERGREGVNEGGRGRLLPLPFERAGKVARCSFTGRLWGLEETQGSRASHQLPICHSLTALSNIAPSRLYQWSKTMKWQTSPPALPVHWNAGLCSHTPRAHSFLLPPPVFSSVFVMLFSTTGHIFFFFSTLPALVSLRSPLDFYLSQRDLQRGKQGFRSLAQVMGGEPEV